MSNCLYEEGKTYRFIVSSANEAIALIRKELGARAHVVSVKQVPNRSFLGFFSAPKLEVLAVLMPEKTNGLVGENTERDDRIYIGESVSCVGNTSAKCFSSGNLEDILKRSGFSGSLLNELKCQRDWSSWMSMDLGDALKSISNYWIHEFKKLPALPLARRVAFLGSPGSGKTTALCHYLTQEVFVLGKKVGVVKLEGEVPNSSESLSAFCDVIASPLWREPFNPDDADPDVDFYFDMPPSSALDSHLHVDWRHRLDEYSIESRVLVLNAAYEVTVLNEIIKRSLEAGATHLVFTHMDEVYDTGRLWPLVLRSGLSPLFLSNSRTIIGKHSESFLNVLLSKTFPPSLVPVN